ncbi:hypothetical protein [Thermogemmatispora sp.]|uniref:hypothetical protein n=1 Tax=Thermogemmatispora sp. TaxID=1968838 RepID=UPI001E0AFDCE|nr:hypothetical protein [Thermogemmatispora sp.]MBX5450987.1 hypothetical protein [Thermogemmatispora sp.]
MEAAEILTRARAGEEKPDGWIILPLQRGRVILSIIGWLFRAALGLILFAVIFPIMVPENYHSVFGAIASTIILGILLFIGLGSIWCLINDVHRLIRAQDYLIVITPEDFVQQAGDRVVHVPLINVRYVTARGRARPDRTPPTTSQLSQLGSASENMVGFLFGRGMTQSPEERRKAMSSRAPTSLAFIDTRTNTEVVVTTDTAYGDPFLIAALLKQYAARVQQIA